MKNLSAFVKTEKLQKLQQQKKSIRQIAIASLVLMFAPATLTI